MRKTIWLMITAIMLTLVQQCVVYAAEENPVLIQMDFENFKKSNTPGISFTKTAKDIVKTDNTHQKSLSLNGNFMIYQPEKMWTDGCYRVSYSFYDALAGKTNYIRIMKDRNGSLTSAGNLNETFVANSKGMGYYRNQKGWVMSENIKPYLQNQWYKIDIWFDFGQKMIYYYIDGERLGAEAMSNLTCVDAIVFQMEGNVYLDDVLIQEITEPKNIDDAPEELLYITENNMVQIDVSSDAVGNAFFDDEPPALNLNLTNTGTEKISWNVFLTVTDWQNRVVWKKEIKDCSPEPGETLTEKIIPDVDKYGIYNVGINLSNGERTIVRKSEFSCIRTPKAKNDRLALCTHIAQRKDADEELVDKMVRFVDKGGFSAVRDEIPWGFYEAVQGVYKTPERSKMYIDKLLDKDVEMYQLLNYGNTFYMNGGDWHPTLPFQIKGYVDYCYNLVSEQKGKVKYYEIYNEWTNCGHTPEEYARLLKPAYEAVKRANPDAVVVGMCPAGTQPNWIESVLIALDGEKCFDAISVHPYWFPTNPERGLAYAINQVHELMAKYGYEGIDVFGSELGYPVCPEFNTELEQAVYGILYFCINDNEKLLKRMYWYDLQNDGWSVNEKEHNFGMIRCWSENGDGVPFAAKPVYLATTQYNSMVADGEIQGRVENDDVSLFHYKKSDCKDVLITASRDKTAKNLSLNLGTDVVSFYDMFGNKKEIYGVDGKYTFIVDDTISYIEGNFKTIEECEPIVAIMEPSVKCIDNSTDYFSISCPEGSELTAKGTESISIEEAGGFENGNTGFVYKTKTAPLDCEKVKAEIKKDGKTLFYAELPTERTSSVVVENIEVRPYSLKDINHWMAEITLKNNSSYDKKNGEISFSSPWQIKEKINKVNFADLAPKTSDKLYIHFPTGIRSMSTLLGVVKTESGEEIPIKKSLETDTAKKIDTPPVIDGKLNEWDFNGGMFAEDESTVTGADYGGLGDLSGKAKVLWDDENMYFAAEVTDDIMHMYSGNDPWNVWNYDSIQLGIASSNTASVITEIGLAITADGPKVYGYSFEKAGTNPGIIENAELEVKRDGFKTYYEASIPWKEFLPDGVKPERGRNICFSMLLNDRDNDSNGRAFMEYGSGIASAKTASLFIKTLLY